MVARAVSARESLTPLAVLIPIGATPVLGLWGGLAAIVVAGRRTYGVP